MISVVIPLYNCRDYIDRCVNSILSQTVPVDEIIIVDDGSADGGAELVEGKGYPRTRLIRQENRGVSAARNKGIRNAKGDFIAFLDADDRWLPNHIATLKKLKESFPGLGFYATSYYFGKDDAGLVSPSRAAGVPQANGLLDYFTASTSASSPVIHISSFMASKELLEKVGGFPEGIPAGEDVITFARMFGETDFAYSPEPTSVYYIQEREGKNIRPVTWHNPIDSMFDRLLWDASHKNGVRTYVAAWHKGRMVGALFAHKPLLALREMGRAIVIRPFYKKIYTSLAASLYAIATNRSLLDLNLSGKGKKAND